MYDYKEGKKRVEEILKSNLEVKENERIPKSEELTFNNSYHTWIASIFIDIRDSSNLFKNGNNKDISKLIKAFTSELIEILRGSDNMREIGIIGDCVYAIYTAPNKKDNKDVYFRACYCNTYIKMLNKLLEKYNLPTFKAGIGLGDAKTLVIKAGRKHVGINDNVWIGDSVVDASNFSSIAHKEGFKNIVMSPLFYNNLYPVHKKIEELFDKKHHFKYGYCYSGNVIMTKFDDWIDNDFKE